MRNLVPKSTLRTIQKMRFCLMTTCPDLKPIEAKFQLPGSPATFSFFSALLPSRPHQSSKSQHHWLAADSSEPRSTLFPLPNDMCCRAPRWALCLHFTSMNFHPGQSSTYIPDKVTKRREINISACISEPDLTSQHMNFIAWPAGIVQAS